MSQLAQQALWGLSVLGRLDAVVVTEVVTGTEWQILAEYDDQGGQVLCGGPGLKSWIVGACRYCSDSVVGELP